MTGDWLTGLGIALCLSQSAMFSGLNLAMFTLNPLRLQIEAEEGNQAARRVIDLRRESNWTLSTILIGNVAVNVGLTVLSDSLMSGLAAFFFSTVIITAFGEIVPQAYFSRHALRMVDFFNPLFRVYRFILAPVAWPIAKFLLDRWLGKEPRQFLSENEFRRLLHHYITDEDAEIGTVEGRGALNFLAADDIVVREFGKTIAPLSIMDVPFEGGAPKFPDFAPDIRDPFLSAIHASGKKWVIFTEKTEGGVGVPRLVMDADGFLRDVLFRGRGVVNPMAYCHAPTLVTNRSEKLGDVLHRWYVLEKTEGHRTIDRDVIIYWGKQGRRKIMTGADILGRLMAGIINVYSPEGEVVSPREASPKDGDHQ